MEAGATLYISLDTGLPSSFEPITGLEPQTRERRRDTGEITLSGLPGSPKIPCGGAFKVRFAPTRAEVLGHEPDGNPAFSVASCGKGKVYFLGVPMEMLLTRTPGSFHAPDAPPCWQVYRHIAADALAGRAVRKQHPLVAVTEHPSAPRSAWSSRSTTAGGGARGAFTCPAGASARSTMGRCRLMARAPCRQTTPRSSP